MRYSICYLFLSFLVFGSCSPRTNVTLSQSARSYKKLASYEPFGIIESPTKRMSHKDFIARVEVKDGGFSTNCDYRTVKSIAKSEAQKIGGNCIVIREHKKPGLSSTCHRIKADVYRIDHPETYEKEILWHKDRKLKVRDFKASAQNRSHLAVTASSFSYNIKSVGTFSKDYIVEAHTYFSCDLSYFKKTDMDLSTLAHEQIHFDITELYARIFLKKIKSKARNIDEALEKSDAIMRTIVRQLQEKQNAYDKQVYPDRSKQKIWDSWIKAELLKYQSYASKIIKVESY